MIHTRVILLFNVIIFENSKYAKHMRVALRVQSRRL